MEKHGDTVSFVIHGEPASKANSRRLVLMGGKPRFIKSNKAQEYTKYFLGQCPQLPSLLQGDIRLDITIHYASRRPDLDESLILDLMQGRIYENDRQVKERHVYWGLDRDNPRAEITVTALRESDQSIPSARQGKPRPRSSST